MSILRTDTFSFWIPQSTNTHDGTDAAQSGNHFNSSRSVLQTTVTGPGTLTFWWRVSSEPTWDYLRFSIDGVRQAQISDDVAWQQISFAISAGSHTLQWMYWKDGAFSEGYDAGWVDQVTFSAQDAPPP